jgi:Protein of unknown function (DUF2793)
LPQFTPRHRLPMLAAAQAQKELTHNEALILLDAVTSPVVQSIAPAAIPASPSVGQCWIIGMSPSGLWSGQANNLACWTDGGWRFVPAFSEMAVWSVADGMAARFDGSAWVKGITNAKAYRVNGTQVLSTQKAAIVGPSGGTNTDSECRIAVNAILNALRAHGLIAT